MLMQRSPIGNGPAAASESSGTDPESSGGQSPAQAAQDDVTSFPADSLAWGGGGLRLQYEGTCQIQGLHDDARRDAQRKPASPWVRLRSEGYMKGAELELVDRRAPGTPAASKEARQSRQTVMAARC